MTTSTVTIIGIPNSTYTRAVRMAAHEKGINYELDPQMPHSEPAKAIHPLGKIPVLRHGDVELAESSAIARYIDTAFAGSPLFPQHPAAAARTEQWISITNTAMDILFVRRYLFAYLFPKGADGTPDREFIDGLVDKLAHHLGIIADAVSEDDYLVGNALTYADLNLYPILYYLGEVPESARIIAASAPLTAYCERMAQRQSAQATVPPARNT